MRAVIVGCGRVGAGLAERLAAAGHEVTVLDIESQAFSRLPHDFSGNAVRGDGTDEDILRRAGAEGADAFFALTEGDNRNILSAQLASENLGVRRVVAKINDPVRSRAYSSMGLATLCRTEMLVDALGEFVGLPRDERVRGVQEPTGSHHAPAAAGDNGRGEASAIGGAMVAGSGPDVAEER